jgi:hypothetical protein
VGSAAGVAGLGDADGVGEAVGVGAITSMGGVVARTVNEALAFPNCRSDSATAWKRQAETPRHRVGAAIGVVHVHAVVPRTGASWMFTTFVHEHG